MYLNFPHNPTKSTWCWTSTKDTLKEQSRLSSWPVRSYDEVRGISGGFYMGNWFDHEPEDNITPRAFCFVAQEDNKHRSGPLPCRLDSYDDETMRHCPCRLNRQSTAEPKHRVKSWTALHAALETSKPRSFDRTRDLTPVKHAPSRKNHGNGLYVRRKRKIDFMFARDPRTTRQQKQNIVQASLLISSQRASWRRKHRCMRTSRIGRVCKYRTPVVFSAKKSNGKL